MSGSITGRSALALGVTPFVKPPPLPWRGGPRPQGNPDADLIALCSDFLKLDSLDLRWESGRENLDDEMSADVVIAWFQMAESIRDTEPTTLAGRVAKLHAAAKAIRKAPHGHSEIISDLVIWVAAKVLSALPAVAAPYTDLPLSAACAAAMDDIFGSVAA
jgi:hypothetical protein